MSSLPSDAPAPRLCIIAKWPDFEGYGFNLHAEKSKPGQYIGKVDEKSPAEAAGLMEDDRIIEVNGVNIANENHKQVVQRIKAVTGETRLLVVDPATDKYYKSKNIVVRGSQENVIVGTSVREQKAPPTSEPQFQATLPTATNGHHEEIDNRSVSSAASSSTASETSTQPQHAAALAEADKDSTVEEVTSHETMEDQKSRSPSPPPAEEAEKTSEEILAPEEDGASLSGSEKISENDVNPPVEDSLPEASETDAPQLEEPLEGREQTLPEAAASEEQEIQQQTEVEEKEEEEEEKEKESENENEEDERKSEATPPSLEQESDLEAEYDNVEIDAGRVEMAASQATSDSRRLSASSGESHSSHGSDTARTDPPPTQSPMSTSPTPPPSLESAPAPEPVRSSPPAVITNTAATNNTATTTTTTTTTTNNDRPKPQPVSNNNNYNSSGLNLNMSAAEMRAMLARKKKADPRKDTVDLKTKYQIIQNM